MRLKIVTRPVGTISGVSLDYFQVGAVYELGSRLGCVFLAEGWAEPVEASDADVLVRPLPDGLADSKPLVLVVDDDEQVRDAAESLLTGHGYHVIVAPHGKHAIHRLRDHCPDLIVLDLDMPVMDGWQFRREQRYLTDVRLAAVPVLLMTGEDEATSDVEPLQAVGLVTKPFAADDLLDAVSAAIGSQPSAPDRIRSTRPRNRTTRNTST